MKLSEIRDRMLEEVRRTPGCSEGTLLAINPERGVDALRKLVQEGALLTAPALRPSSAPLLWGALASMASSNR